MNTFAFWLKRVWATSSPLRHAVGAFLAIELTPYVTQVYQWSIGNGALPDWSLAAQLLGKALIGAVMLYFLRLWQKPKSPEQPA